MSEFAEVFDHPDKPGEFLTAEELDEYNRAKHDEALSLASEAKAKETNNVLDVDRRHPGSFLPGKAQSMWLDDFDPFFSHPANVKVVEKDLKQASALKAKGNEYYKGKYYDTAHKYYSRAIAYCPVGEEHGYSRAVFYSNRAACCMAQEEYRDAIEDCSMALDADPSYLKALLRRCKAFEMADDLEHAVQDIDKVVEMDGGSSRNFLMEQHRLRTAKAESEEKMKKEMMDKLKGLGNTILGKFGMSLDNFKFNQQQDGTYSVNFEQ